MSAAATVSAEPELRDFKKESTAFLPSALKRKKGGGTTGGGSRINAAPTLGSDVTSEGAAQAKPDLLGALREKLGPMAGTNNEDTPELDVKKRKLEPSRREKPKDDYDKFLAEMGDFLAPS